MTIHSCGVIVKTIMGEQKAMITACTICFDKVRYELTYFYQGEFKTIWVTENEFEVTEHTKTKIGFKK